MTDFSFNRRNLLGTAASAAAFSFIPRHILGGSGYNAANDKLNIAAIGIGGVGSYNLKNLESENIAALCDVDHSNAAKIFERYPKARRYKDYREMLEKEKDIDAVVIATPDHTHAVITIACMQAGKHVYCQKPLTHTVAEAREVARVAKETGVVTQMGIQGHSGEGINLVCEWIWDGAIGDVHSVDGWCSLAYYPPGQAYWCTTHYDIPDEKPPVPDGLDWDLWLGPAPYRDYHPTYHPGRWRAWYDFGCGMMGDRGVHTLDAVFLALKLKQPESVSATVSNLNDQTNPISSIVQFDFAPRGDLPAVKLNWYEGIRVPRPDELEDKRTVPPEGGLLIKGDKGTIMCGIYADSPRIIPETKMQQYKRPAKMLRRVETSHETEWVEAIKQGRKANADFEYSARLTEFVLLGNIAKRTQSKIYYDQQQMKITNNDIANNLLSKKDRTGW
ncbi:4-carboxy-2-hydroxymuconate-6-semialdehyde dehydrogenase [Limihaloglobus sulfuriphilus]|uniref:4-carboxy-2-hydroxymuconate-6-semialdehyde dehydrogenase n=1 Tax=Limihaloglobus sulfuriphilus TaxID=1851148 RepID=A0A1Q2MAP4_9BACT|nr:Gfo/Idh/MocA family oxidoreductase [Limihaloglobus sulfuriphilus]AQQ69729.1 4-carboxy-2-hydroxymuconate-6-semialdehyde dehydrogenase [Limihaloglobus sulfuriphilus]